ncbi:hypothetical protein TPL01_32220 [Sulfuriferula plumbiphila]|uniref:ABC transporter domain-containing protein n=1 Tax=Sulfuriferula plumbiphila TaxID=171865 RepID=A0A512LC59_9PROT|nr:hypothetical protein SFPGR_14940 [Sulfuriferula plumbiphila]GEP32084.1 hypothetical protein TPL01_32220 [Sulfuriferula plumbiphila]
MRVNLTALENIALVEQFHQAMSWTQASARAQRLLDSCGHGDIAMKRDEDLTPTQRFAVKLARAIQLRRPLLVIDRPALLLADVPYPDALGTLLARLADVYPAHRILDYTWNQALYGTMPQMETHHE